jgi:hypothetical protein
MDACHWHINIVAATMPRQCGAYCETNGTSCNIEATYMAVVMT